uniref:Alcohol dehydrogenase n=1 Tax=Kwoniella dejecticola CBS 10117 TaxID=1296121 RepID=A0A1A6A288_9TREE|nr:alcohol dehydrogenase [Kwoniella dejecticola CBS 10117]OBR84177.1 alcohol dehydrogenase [Kwoniella dejecticola CBS 10117]
MSSSSTIPETMQAVIFKDTYKVAVEQVPTPTLQSDGDIILKVHLAGLCGSDLHLYRGHEDAGKGYIMGHEVVGTIVEKGQSVKKFNVGDVVAVPFTVSCGSCWYCSSGHTARCASSQLFGTPSLQGCQAEYVRIPLADGCVFHKPDNLPDELMLLMADILPTGYSAAANARALLDGSASFSSEEEKDTSKKKRDGVCVVIGCGPVGLCAISSAKTLFSQVFATDLALSRLALAEKHGAIALPSPELKKAVLDATDGRGADAVLEVVGHEGALLTALDLVRPYGAVSSVGVHSKEIRLNGGGLYDKK